MHLNCILPTRKFTILLWVQNSKFRSDWQQNVAHALPGPDYFDEEAKCYLGCLNFAKSHFAVPDSEVACFWQNINKLPSILPPRQNNPVAAVMMLSVAMNQVEPNSSSRLICSSGLEQNLSGLEFSCPI